MIRRNFKGNSALSKKVKPRKKNASDIEWEKKSKKIWKDYDDKKKKEHDEYKKNLDVKKNITKSNPKKKLTRQKQINKSIKSQRYSRGRNEDLKKSTIILNALRPVKILEKLLGYGYEEGKISSKDAIKLFNAVNDLRKLGITSLPKDLDEAKYWIVCKELKNMGFPITPNTTKEGEECKKYIIIHNQLKKRGYEGVPKSVEDAKNILNELELDERNDSLKEINRKKKSRERKFSKTREFTTF